MIWDRGTWKPEVEDVDAALAKGDLKFTLRGKKLRGSWVLVRMRSRQWLLDQAPRQSRLNGGHRRRQTTLGGVAADLGRDRAARRRHRAAARRGREGRSMKIDGDPMASLLNQHDPRLHRGH
jgi:bifunctional non-homologous end joining protein LigD